MTLAFDFHPEAEAELVADVDWYDDAWPMWPGWDREPVARSKGVGDFPYRVVYLVGADVVTVLAVAHTKRRPGYWRHRVTG